MATKFAVLLGVAAAAQPREWSVILDAPSRWAKPLSQASVSRELAPVFVDLCVLVIAHAHS